MAQTPVVLPFPSPEASAQYQGQPYDTGDSPLPEAASLNSPIREFIEQTKGMAPERAVDALTWRIHAIDEVYRTGFVQLGLICREVRDRQLWEIEVDPETMHPFHSMSAWIIRSAPYSYRHCHSAMTALDSLPDIPLDALAKVQQCNIAQLRQMSTAVRTDPDVLEAASNLSEVAFAEKIAAEHPEQHIAPRRRLIWNLELDVIRVINEAVDVAMLRQDCKTREEAIEAICADYIATYSVQMQ